VAAVGLQLRVSRLGQADQRPAAIGRVGAARDHPVALEVADGLRHRLRPHPLGGGEVADALGALAVEAAEDGALGDREGVLGAQAADQLPEHDAQVAGDRGDVRLCRHAAEYSRIYAGELHSLPV
jgi:hypothetical protein